MDNWKLQSASRELVSEHVLFNAWDMMEMLRADGRSEYEVLEDLNFDNIHSQNEPQIEALEEDKGRIEGEISDQEDVVAKIEEEISEIEDAISDLEDEIIELQDEDGDVSDGDASMAEDIQANIDELEIKRDALGKELEDEEKSLEEMNDALSDTEEEIEDLKDRCTEFEIYEYRAVSEWLSRKLSLRNEIVGEALGVNVWCRQCTGQSMAIDSVMMEIAAENYKDYDMSKVFLDGKELFDVNKIFVVNRKYLSGGILMLMVDSLQASCDEDLIVSNTKLNKILDKCVLTSNPIEETLRQLVRYIDGNNFDGFKIVM